MDACFWNSTSTTGTNLIPVRAYVLLVHTYNDCPYWSRFHGADRGTYHVVAVRASSSIDDCMHAKEDVEMQE